jgi:hypothetical protein
MARYDMIKAFSFICDDSFQKIALSFIVSSNICFARLMAPSTGSTVNGIR